MSLRGRVWVREGVGMGFNVTDEVNRIALFIFLFIGFIGLYITASSKVI